MSGGVALLTISTFPAGNHSLTATYSGDGNFIDSTSLIFVQTVSKSSSTTSLISTTNQSRFGQAITLTATVVDGFGLPGGSVEFLDGAASLGSANLKTGVAMLTISTLPVGNHSITARYAETRNFLGSVSASLSQVVDKSDTSTALLSSSRNNTSQFGKSVTFTATVSAISPGGGTPSGTVQFYDGTTPLDLPQTLTRGQAKISTNSLSKGSHSITVLYSGDGSFNGNTSPVLVQQVN